MGGMGVKGGKLASLPPPTKERIKYNNLPIHECYYSVYRCFTSIQAGGHIDIITNVHSLNMDSGIGETLCKERGQRVNVIARCTVDIYIIINYY